MERRTFLRIASGMTVVATLPACASVGALAVRPVDGAVRIPLASHPGLKTRGGQLRLRLADTGEQIYVLALEGGEYAALSPICTHLGCTVDVAGPRLVCPCHGSTYDRTGRVLRGPAENPLRRYPVSVSPQEELIVRVEGGA